MTVHVGDLELDRRELSLILAALSAQARYHRTLLDQAVKRPNSAPETQDRNAENLLEVTSLIEKLGTARWAPSSS